MDWQTELRQRLLALLKGADEAQRAKVLAEIKMRLGL
jgi:hypothetical protein